jgi:hypothetical protein
MASTLNSDNGVVSGSAGLKSTADSSGVLALQTNGTTAVTVDTSQNVGIGTANPQAKLHVNTTSAALYIGFGGNFDNYIQTNGNTIFTNYNASAERMRIDSSGNVGIGTASPTSASGYGALTLGGSTGGLLSFKVGSTDTGYVLATSSEFAFKGTTAIPATFYTNNTERVRIDSSGNVAIGTTATAGQRLTIASNGNSAAANAFYVYNSTPIALFTIRNDGAIYSGTAPASPYNLTTATAANMYVDSGGVVYRSTSSLRYKQNVQDYGKGLSDLAKLRPVTFNSKPKEDEENVDTHTYAGFIAEEVHQAGLIEFVQYNNEGQPDALSYANMVALLTKSIQEQQALITQLQADVAALKGATA